jgi:hypothetical protein
MTFLYLQLSLSLISPGNLFSLAVWTPSRSRPCFVFVPFVAVPHAVMLRDASFGQIALGFHFLFSHRFRWIRMHRQPTPSRNPEQFSFFVFFAVMLCAARRTQQK